MIPDLFLDETPAQFGDDEEDSHGRDRAKENVRLVGRAEQVGNQGACPPSGAKNEIEVGGDGQKARWWQGIEGCAEHQQRGQEHGQWRTPKAV